jgi:uncharacterized protein YbaP (TraB family)
MESGASWISRSRGLTGPAALTAAALAAVLALGSAAARDADPAFTAGLLWRVSKPGVKDSFVFGTIHLPDPRVNAVPKAVEESLAQSGTLAMELIPGVIADGRVFDLELLDDGRTLESLIGPEAFARVRGELGGREIPDRVIAQLKPWAALVKLGRTPAREGEQSLDQRLLAAGRARHLRLAPLELPDEQIAAFDTVPMESQVALLKHALEHRDALDAATEPTIAAWLRGDLQGLARIGDRMGEQFPGMSRHYRELTKHIIYDRTVVMHHRLVLPLRAGRVFVAVGAMHLYGSKGLLALLRDDGYRVTRIW